MNTYQIKCKIATLAKLGEGFEYGGYQFDAYDTSEWWSCDAWVVSKTIEAERAGEARSKFIIGLIPLIEEFSVVSQCAFRVVANTYFIYKLTDNPENIIYIYYVRSRDPVGLSFDEEEKSQLPKFSGITNKNGLLYMMEAANVTTYYARLAMFIMAVEGFAGELEVKGRKITNTKVLVEILGEELYGKLYTQDRLRHLLIHGNVGTAEQRHLFDGLADEIYRKIRTYLKQKYDIQLEENVVNPQRNFYDNFEAAGMFNKFKMEPVLDLKQIEEACEDRYGHNSKEEELFTYLGESPTDY